MDYNGSARDMVLRGIAAIVTCIVLIFLLVFFTNRETLKESFAGRTQTDTASGTVTVEQEGNRTEFGLQIGDNLKAFIADETFFDDHTIIPVTEEYTEEEVISVSILAASEDGDLVIRLFDAAGTVLSGERFKANVSREEAGRQIDLVFVDDDEDGVIRAKGLTNGEWQITVQELDGYHMPTQGAKITLGGEDASSAASSGETTDNDNNDNNNNNNNNSNNNDNSNDNGENSNAATEATSD